ncbi:MAG: M15 family metallopeptidase, partial [Oscillospiraceae bacterium]|nr:M15 family metallopeptidase [Oscillospiraceae bacterium]
EYQEYLYAQGRTRPGSIVTNGKVPTFHADTAGLAFDFCRNVRGHEYDDNAFFAKAAAIAKGLGFSWGGDWKSFPDMPHIQWDDHGAWTGAMILAGKLPPGMPPCTQRREENTEMRYDTVEQCPQWAQASVRKLIERGYLAGNGRGLDLSGDMVRMIVILDRALVFERSGEK